MKQLREGLRKTPARISVSNEAVEVPENKKQAPVGKFNWKIAPLIIAGEKELRMARYDAAFDAFAEAAALTDRERDPVNWADSR